MSPAIKRLCMTFFANSHDLYLDSCPLLGRLAHRYQIPEHFTALFALKHSNVALLATHLFMKAFEQIGRPNQRGQGLRKIDRQVDLLSATPMIPLICCYINSF